MVYDFIVLGATGLQGKIASRDLLESGYSVLMCGRDKSRILHLLKHKKSAFASFDASDFNGLVKLIKKSGAKIVVNCVEGDWNLQILKASIKAGVHSLDLGSDIPMTKAQLALDKELKKNNLIHITGCGSVPGIGNVMLRYADEKFDKIDKMDVGFAWDSNIKEFVVPFSIMSILEEFQHPADMLVNHHYTTVKPMNTVARCFHRAIGKEKCFNVGHHPETLTMHRFAHKKGVKEIKFFAGFPDHSFNVLQMLVKLGFGEEKVPIDYKGMKILPVNFLTEVLKKLKIPKGYKETENLWVHIYGKHNGKERQIKMECIVPTLPGWEDAGCNIDTGMTASVMAQMIKKNQVTDAGSFSPEFIIPPEPFFKEIAKRKMIVYENGTRIN